jgi:predicted ABC-class ATPase
MKPVSSLRETLRRIDGRGYKAYKDIQGIYDSGNFTLFVDYVQGDPFAAPSRIRVRIPLVDAGFPAGTHSTGSRAIGLRDFLTREFAKATEQIAKKRRGSGKSGLIRIDRPGQEILERTSVILGTDYIEARFVMGLPAHGRRIAGREADVMFFRELPAIVEQALFWNNVNKKDLLSHIEVNEDADYLRQLIAEEGLIAFVADGAILPRASGVDNRPLTESQVVLFRSPDELKIQFELPDKGTITGMGIPAGITLIVGGGYHGKSTLLNALEQGIYNHIPGDGREFVVSVHGAFKIRAEDGRSIEKVDISPFIGTLPFGQETRSFSTEDASGSTSQAANIMEMLEIGAEVLLIDEDTSATNFMIRDHRMQELVLKEKEPITPFIDKVRQLYDELGVSSVLVIGGSGDYFDVADRVICMEEYRPFDCTDRSRAIAVKYRAERSAEGGERFGQFRRRIPLAGSFNARKGKREVKISPKGLQTIAFGTHAIDLGAVEQLVDVSQTNAIGDAIYHSTRYMDGKRTLVEVVDAVFAEMDKKGLDALSTHPIGDYAAFRRFELAAAINRLRTLKVRQ